MGNSSIQAHGRQFCGGRFLALAGFQITTLPSHAGIEATAAVPISLKYREASTRWVAVSQHRRQLSHRGGADGGKYSPSRRAIVVTRISVFRGLRQQLTQSSCGRDGCRSHRFKVIHDVTCWIFPAFACGQFDHRR
jgi:hypothetical protein